MTAPVAVHHVVEGPPDAPALVLSHPLGGALALWEPQARALARQFRVIRYDLRGHGGSPVPPSPYTIEALTGDLLALVDRLSLPRVHLAGISLGGLVSLAVAARAPERVDRLVVLCTAASFPPATTWIERAALVRARGTAAVADVAVDRWLTPGFRARHGERVAAFRALYAATPRQGYAGACAVLERTELGPALGSIAAPTLAIAGAADPATPVAALARIAEGIPRGRLAVVAGAAHLANVEQADEVTDLIRRHLTNDLQRGGT